MLGSIGKLTSPLSRTVIAFAPEVVVPIHISKRLVVYQILYVHSASELSALACEPVPIAVEAGQLACVRPPIAVE